MAADITSTSLLRFEILFLIFIAKLLKINFLEHEGDLRGELLQIVGVEKTFCVWTCLIFI